MFSSKDFWFAIVFLIFDVTAIFSLIRGGVHSYLITGIVLFTFLAAAFFRRALKKR